MADDCNAPWEKSELNYNFLKMFYLINIFITICAQWRYIIVFFPIYILTECSEKFSENSRRHPRLCNARSLTIGNDNE